MNLMKPPLLTLLLIGREWFSLILILCTATVGVNLYKLQAKSLGQAWISKVIQPKWYPAGCGFQPSKNLIRDIHAADLWGCFTCLGLYAKRPFREIYSIQIRVTSKGAMVLPLVGCLNSASQSLSKPPGNRNNMENMGKLWETDKRSWT